jgi:hypothetical protein
MNRRAREYLLLLAEGISPEGAAWAASRALSRRTRRRWRNRRRRAGTLELAEAAALDAVPHGLGLLAVGLAAFMNPRGSEGRAKAQRLLGTMMTVRAQRAGLSVERVEVTDVPKDGAEAPKSARRAAPAERLRRALEKMRHRAERGVPSAANAGEGKAT